MTSVLVCTLGASWAVVPEVYGFLAPERLPLYRHHPGLQALEREREDYGLKAPDEIWVCTTCGDAVRRGLGQLAEWRDLLPDPKPVLRVWQAAGTGDLVTAEECARLRELIARVVLFAHEHAQGGQVVLSLAGGRKTMSADLQWAGERFGCAALIHVVGEDRLPEELKCPTPARMARALDAAVARAIVPVVLGSTRRSELLDLDADRKGRVTAKRFRVRLAANTAEWAAPDKRAAWLAQEIARRESRRGELFGNFLRVLGEREHHENWRSLYRLPPRVIKRLRTERLGPAHVDLLRRLPKADLHRHLGGALDLDAQRRVARVIHEAGTAAERSEAREFVGPWLQGAWPPDWPDRLRKLGPFRPHAAAVLLLEETPERLEQYLYGATEPRVALVKRHRDGFRAYERPGELSGSALLAHPAALEPYAEAVVDQALAEGLAYVELRGSPRKYDQDPMRFLRSFRAALKRALARHPEWQRPRVRFTLIADRRDGRDTVRAVVEDAVRAHDEMPDFIAGIDLAGDEKQAPAGELAPCFEDAFAECLPVTIHAGEGQPADSIWEAAYRLHADRIGHGLTLHEDPKLAPRFRNRRICIELCPTSNREVVGYRDRGVPESLNCPPYPLRRLLDAGLPLTLCTDNPGISRTTLADEYLTASRMLETGLTLWKALAIMRQGFVHAFLDADAREKLLKKVDHKVYRLVSAWAER